MNGFSVRAALPVSHEPGSRAAGDRCAGRGAVTLLIVPIFDRVLNPASSDSNILLFKVPFGGPPILREPSLPHSIHNVGR